MPLDPSSPKQEVKRLLESINNGEFVIPRFQRKFKWDPSMAKDLLVSVISDFFSGLILLWQQDPEEAKKETWDPIWGAKVGKNISFAVLDGQQRLSSLYYAIYNPQKTFPERRSYYLFFINLKKYLEKDFEECVFYRFYSNYRPTHDLKNEKDDFIEKLQLPLALFSDRDFLKDEYDKWIADYTRKLKERHGGNELEIFRELSNLKQRILDYEFPIYILGRERSPFEVASIFAKINQSGLRLTTFDLMNAFLYPKGVSLRTSFDNLNHERMKQIPGIDELLLKTMSLYKQGYSSPKYIYNLVPGQKIFRMESGKKKPVILVNDGGEFNKLWDKSVKSCEYARERIMNTGGDDFGSIKVDFIPNNTTIPVIAAIRWVYDEKYRNLISEGEFNKMLSRWYWNAVLSKDYSGSSDTIMSKDFRDLKSWLEGKEKPERIKSVENVNEMISELRNERKGTSVYNALISLLALRGAEDFITGRSPGSVDYIESGIDDHHIFPSRVKGLDPNKTKEFQNTKDNIVNRTLLLDTTNKRISNDKPSEYLKIILENLGGDEGSLYNRMNAHFISKKALNYMWNDNYDEFIREREENIQQHLKKLVNSH